MPPWCTKCLTGDLVISEGKKNFTCINFTKLDVILSVNPKKFLLVLINHYIIRYAYTL